MRSSRLLHVSLVMLALAMGFSFISVNVSRVYAYPYYGWPYYGSSNYCYGYGYNNSSYCPYNNYYGGYYPYYWGMYYPYYYGYYSYPYSYSYSYYTQPNQYQLTVNVDPSNTQAAVTGAGSYNQGSSATFSASQNIIQVSQNTRYLFSHWTGDYSGQGLSGTVIMDSAKTVTAVYQLQYYLTVNSPSNASSIQGSGWYNSGDSATLTLQSLIVGATDSSRLVFNGWNVDETTGPTSSALTIQMNAPHNVTAQYKQQYYLTVVSDQGPTSGTGWYDAGTQTQISASTPPSPAYGISMVFNGWTGPVGSASSQSTTVLMDGPKTVTATWRADATILYATIIAVVAVIAVSAYLLANRRKESATKVTPAPDTPKVEESSKEGQ